MVFLNKTRLRCASRLGGHIRSVSTWPLLVIPFWATRSMSLVGSHEARPLYFCFPCCWCRSSLGLIEHHSTKTEGQHEERYKKELQGFLWGEEESSERLVRHLEEPNQATQEENNRSGVPGDLGYFLHSWKFVFNHLQVPNKRMRITCPPPPSFQAVWGKPFPLS